MRPEHFFRRTAIVVCFLLLCSTVCSPVIRAEQYALLVGINEYRHAALPPLKYAVNDVAELGKVLKDASYQVTLLTDETGRSDEKRVPTKANIERCLHEVLQRCKKGDTLLLALTGHGLQFGGQKDAYYCPVDARPLESETATLISITKVYAELEASFAGVKIVLVDACRNDPTPGRGRGLDADTAPNPPKGVGVLFSCSAGQRAFEHDDLKHGVFFHYVLEGLRKDAADKQGRVTFDGLSSFVRESVSDKVHELFPEQKPDQFPNVKADLTGKPPVLLTLSGGHAPQPVKKPDGLAGARAGRQWDSNGLKMKLCWCPPGQFAMGSPPGELHRDAREEAQVDVTISRGFWLGKFEVTQSQWERLMGTTVRQQHDKARHESVAGEGPDYPMYSVNYDEATEFCNKLNQQERKARRLPPDWEYRLPTEAQWEYACRAGSKTATAFGDRLGGRQAHVKGDAPYNGAEASPVVGRNIEVGGYAANAWGLHDMHGSVGEWCRDWHQDRLPGGKDPEVVAPSSKRSVRGSGWYDSAGFARSACRGKNDQGFRGYAVGFRVAVVFIGATPSESATIESIAAQPSEVKPQPVETSELKKERDKLIENSIAMKLVFIPPGEFRMGSSDADVAKALRGDAESQRAWMANEQPQHRVRITQGFYMGVYEVTQAEYKRVMEKNPSYFSKEGAGKEKVAGLDTSQFPVEMVCWDDAREFCRRLSALDPEKRAGRRHRLPTEAEWEYACRAGTTTGFHFGDVSNGRQANTDGQHPFGTSEKGPDLGRPSMVGSYGKNAFGLFDMHGNVLEWCDDYYDEKFYEKRLTDDPVNRTDAQSRVFRGGSWQNRPWYIRASRRSGEATDFRNNNTGFRICVDILAETAAEPTLSGGVVPKQLPVDIEKQAESRLVLAKGLIDKNAEGAKRRLEELIREHPNTKAAVEARDLLKQLN